MRPAENSAASRHGDCSLGVLGLWQYPLDWLARLGVWRQWQHLLVWLVQHHALSHHWQSLLTLPPDWRY